MGEGIQEEQQEKYVGVKCGFMTVVKKNFEKVVDSHIM